MAILIVQQGGGGGTYSSLAAAAAAANVGDTIRIQGSWSIADPGGPVTLDKASLTVEALSTAATQGVVDESSGSYWRLLNSANAHGIHCLAEGITLRGLTVKNNHSNNNKSAVRGRGIITVEGCVLYGQSSSSATGQHGLSMELNQQTYNVVMRNTVCFKLRGSGFLTERVGFGTPLTGIVRISGCTFMKNLAGVERIGLSGENNISYLLHSCNFGQNVGTGAESQSITWNNRSGGQAPHSFWVDYCISDDGNVVDARFDQNISCLASQQVQDSPFATGQIVENRDTYPYDFNLLEDQPPGDNVLVDYHDKLSYTQVPPFVTNHVLSPSIGGVLRDPSLVDVGAFELVKVAGATGDIDQDLPFIEQSATGQVAVITADIDTDGPFIEQAAQGKIVTVGTGNQDFPFIEQDLLGDVIIRGFGVQDLPFIEIDATGTLPDQEVEGDIDQDLPFIEQAATGSGLRIWDFDTDAPFIEIEASAIGIILGAIDQDLPFVDQDAAGNVFTVSQIVQDLPFIEQAADGEVTVQGDIDQDLPFIKQQAEFLGVWSTSVINTLAPFIDQDAVSSATSTGNIVMDLPFLNTEPGPGDITMTLPFIEQQAEGIATRAIGDIDQDLPFIEQQAIGGQTPPKVGNIVMDLPFIANCLDGRVPANADIDQDLPFIEHTIAGVVDLTGDVVQDLPFVDVDARGPGALDEDWLTRVCEHSVYALATVRRVRIETISRRIRIQAIRRRARFVCQTFDVNRIKTAPIPWDMIGGEPMYDLEGNPIEFLVEVE